MKPLIAVVVFILAWIPSPGISQDSVSYKINGGQVADILNMGDDIDSVLLILSKRYRILKSGTTECRGCADRSNIYYVMDKKGLLFTIEPGWSSSNSNKIVRFTTQRKEFVTKEGIRPGMSFDDLREKYRISNINYSGGSLVYIIVAGFNGSFSIEIPENITVTTTDYAHKIPFDAIIKEIILIYFE
jgi:hypothetical protein